MSLVSYIDAAQQYFDDLVDKATDDELFAGGYLRGHFDLAVGYAQVEELNLTTEELNSQVESSLVKAYRNGELNEDDKALVVRLWDEVKSLA
ncbi:MULTISPECIES: YfcL family protein [Pseudoalteromonas]|uniref:YfcL family protein n=1 Tax=Pseudoalteromonas TaxID=53246 RepID=UPI0007847796|nr:MULTISPECIES: YfcL family protein [Gammaproteobacteria]MCF7498660.1 YfcL family protein [Pseudoalteromonas sp. L1]RZF93128.1 YfcL family protein [Pseudoalteromonas sp. CO302Y]RZG09963.1 YfcL family protein [Pseudoalteromonas sp. CO133X]UJX24583.1 YfcL family protein [Pseudoalteromonas sp. CF6-2]WOC25246.1 YfcL family protein [Pseudoalteromonas sp. N1230-9]|tara:strand:- start:3941 stop:4216 length:276 start_codon:yes stop_codon:yes gene_type:complete